MTMQDLREHGVLLPEEEWGEHRLETTVPEWGLAGSFLAAAAAWWGIYVGDGGAVTWIALGVFLAALGAITWICDRAILRQRRRFREERRALDAEGSAGPERADGEA